MEIKAQFQGKTKRYFKWRFGSYGEANGVIYWPTDVELPKELKITLLNQLETIKENSK